MATGSDLEFRPCGTQFTPGFAAVETPGKPAQFRGLDKTYPLNIPTCIPNKKLIHVSDNVVAKDLLT